jgi:hypothetical protein
VDEQAERRHPVSPEVPRRCGRRAGVADLVGALPAERP